VSQSRRLLMADLSLGTAEVGVDRGSQNGVCECQLSARAKHLRAYERGCRVGCFVCVELGERRREREVGLLPQDRHGTGECFRRGAETMQPLQYEARERFRTELADACCASRTWTDPLRGKRVDELVHQERIPGAGCVHGLRELGRRVALQFRPKESGHRVEAERGWAHERNDGLRLERAQDRRFDAGLSCPNADHHDNRKPFEPASEVRDKTLRGRIAPMEVVDREQGGSEFDDVRSEPEEPVERGMGSVLPAGQCCADRANVEERRREPCGAGQEPDAFVLAACGQSRLEQLTHDAIGEILFELAATGTQHLDASGE
jgi:hypothetical protein